MTLELSNPLHRDYPSLITLQIPLISPSALSTCPGGDLSKPMWGEGAVPEGSSPDEDPTLECCRPLRVEVWEIPEKTLKDGNWESPKPLGELYKGLHGMRSQPKEWKK